MNESLKKRLGAGVRARRNATGLSQEKFAPTISMTVRYLAGIERGERNLTLDSVDDLAQRLGVDPIELFSEGAGLLASDQPNGGSSSSSAPSKE